MSTQRGGGGDVAEKSRMTKLSVWSAALEADLGVEEGEILDLPSGPPSDLT